MIAVIFRDEGAWRFRVESVEGVWVTSRRGYRTKTQCAAAWRHFEGQIVKHAPLTVEVAS